MKWAFLFYSQFIWLLVTCTGAQTSVVSRVAPGSVRLQTTDDLYRFLTYRENRYPLVSAHRGGPVAGYPENAIETFEYQLAKQPLIIECDVAMSKDSVLVLMHDDKLERTTTGKGLLKQHTVAELGQLYLKDPAGAQTRYRIPELGAVLKWGKGRTLFTLDVKRGVPYEKVIEAVRKAGAEANAVIITYTADQAAKVYRLAPELMISASIRKRDDLFRLNEYGVPDNRLVAFVGTSEPDEALYRLLHDHSIPCILGTMGNLDKQARTRGDEVYYDLIARGADVLSTDRPEQAGQQLELFRRDKKIESHYIK